MLPAVAGTEKGPQGAKFSARQAASSGNFFSSRASVIGSLPRFAFSNTFQIDTRRLPHRAATLSGGNQQKVALGKWLGAQPRVVLVEEPTRGVDVGARAEIYAHLRRLANEGLAVVFASSDLPEVLGLADTVASFYRGRLVRVAPAQEWTAARLLSDVMHAPAAETAA